MEPEGTRFLEPGTDIMQEIAGSKGFREFLGRQFRELAGDMEMFLDAPPLAGFGMVSALGIKGVLQVAKQVRGISKLKQLVVPVMRSAEDAEKYGRSIIGNLIAQKQLKGLYEQNLTKLAQMKVQGVSRQVQMEHVLHGQNLREALEVAEGILPGRKPVQYLTQEAQPLWGKHLRKVSIEEVTEKAAVKLPSTEEVYRKAHLEGLKSVR